MKDKGDGVSEGLRGCEGGYGLDPSCSGKPLGDCQQESDLTPSTSAGPQGPSWGPPKLALP